MDNYKGRCPTMGIQQQCNQQVKGDDKHCYYHQKIATGLTTTYEAIGSYDDDISAD